MTLNATIYQSIRHFIQDNYLSTLPTRVKQFDALKLSLNNVEIKMMELPKEEEYHDLLKHDPIVILNYLFR